MNAISTPNAPAAIGPYSQAIVAGNTVYVSGQLPIDPSTGEFKEGCIRCKTRQSLLNIKNILAAEGLTMKNVVKVTVLLTDINDFAAVNEVYADFFGFHHFLVFPIISLMFTPTSSIAAWFILLGSSRKLQMHYHIYSC